MAETRQCSECGAALTPDAPLGLCPKCVLKLGVDSRPSMQTSPAEGPAASDSLAFTPFKPEELAPHFPNLEILELLGQGGMGVVYKARQPQLERLVALKILSPRIGTQPAFAERFTREARSLARLSHPHIVTVYDFGQAGGLYYFLMEYVDGVSLREMERSQRLEPRQALSIVVEICEALQFAHDEGIVHRDIKPENVLIDKKGRVKIADFGLAKLLAKAPTDHTLTQPQQVMGTPHYMAPEQLEHPTEVDQRADIYSLGVVLYEMLTGELPLGRFQPPSQKVQVDVRLDEVVLKTLEKEPERRYQQASQVKTDVEEISRAPQAPPVPSGTAASKETPGQPASPPAVPGHPKTCGRAVAALVCGIVSPLTLGLAGIAGVVLGILAIRKIDRSGGQLTGRGLAIAGIIVSAAFFVLSVPVGLAMTVPLLFLVSSEVPGPMPPLPERSATVAPRPMPPLPARSATVVVPPEATELRRYPLDTLEDLITSRGVMIDKEVSSDGNGSLKIVDHVGGQIVRLFETGPIDVQNARLIYQAHLRTQDMLGPVCLEMWCHFPDGGEFFSRGLGLTLSGTNDWVTDSIPFYLRGSQKPDNVKLNLVIGGKGTVWIDDIRLLRAPLE